MAVLLNSASTLCQSISPFGPAKNPSARAGIVESNQLMKRLGREHRIPGQVAMEQVMACGLGPCYVCVRTFEVNGRKELRRVCIEGPVFDLQEATGW